VDPLHDVVDEAWFALDRSLNVVATLTRTARELCAMDPVGQPLRAVFASRLSGDDLQSLLSTAGAALADRSKVEHRLSPLTIAPARMSGAAHAARLCEPRLRTGSEPYALLLGFRDVTDQLRQRASLEHLQAAAALALAVLSADSAALQSYLRSANVSIALIKSLLQMPARDPAAFRQKLDRILAEVLTLHGEAAALGLTAIADGAREFEAAVAAIAAADQGGDDFLPLAARLNELFTHVTAATALLERRDVAQQRPRSTSTSSWPAQFDVRLRALADRLARQFDHRTELVLIGLDQVPEYLQGSIEGMLTHLVGNAVEHGIEPAGRRAAAGKRPHGTLTVQVAGGEQTLELSVQDDGQGFDMDKLGRAAVARGLLTEDTLQRTDARALIGLIFRPGFSTASVSAPGRGVGMEFLRELVARLDGRITVATKPRQYTRFRIELPLRARGRRRAAGDVA
jgi:chemotaxis protein histidine kinase CheA